MPNQKPPLARRVAEVAPFHVMELLARAKELEAAGRTIVHMALGLKENFAELDAQLAAYAAGLNVNYLSPARIFCDKDGCLTRLGETGDTITFWDCCHLTDAGSRFLMTSLARADRKP